MKLSDHQSRAVVCPAHQRVDPYWSGMWNPGGTANWFSRPTVQRLADQGLITPPKWLAKDPADAMLDIARGTRSLSARRALAAIGCFRTLTTEQLACITGEPLFATNYRAEVYTNLLASGLASEGIVKTPGRSGLPRLVRPYVPGAAGLRPLLAHLRDEDAVGLSHGQPWKAGSMHDRHNMLATELLLRMAEYTNVELVLGEQLAAIERLANIPTKRAGDGVFVLPGGGVVVIEMTANTPSSFPDKVEAWVTALGQNPNLAVLWVDITHPDHADRSAQVSKVIRREVKDKSYTMGAIQAGVPHRIFVAKWADWFPAAGEVSADFFSLRAMRPVGTGDDVWHPVNLADPFGFTLPPSGLGLLANSNLLHGVPHWMQRGHASLQGLAASTAPLPRWAI